jgi:hypothetical protein
MARNNNAFAIDDTLGTSDNLAVYTQLVEALDARLGAALSSCLAQLVAGQRVDTAAIWDVLYVATAPLDPDPVPAGGRAGGEEGAA